MPNAPPTGVPTTISPSRFFGQLKLERYPEPSWIVASCGTGGTSATLGRYVRYRRHATRIACADPDNSVFFDAFASGRRDLTLNAGSRIEGIGRPRVEASFMPSVIDAMFQVPDEMSIAATRWLAQAWGANRVAPPVASLSRYCSWPAKCRRAANAVLSSPCYAMAVNVTRILITTTRGSARIATTLRPRWPPSMPVAATVSPCPRTWRGMIAKRWPGA